MKCDKCGIETDHYFTSYKTYKSAPIFECHDCQTGDPEHTLCCGEIKAEIPAGKYSQLLDKPKTPSIYLSEPELGYGDKK